jgi:hypothetical protein
MRKGSGFWFVYVLAWIPLAASYTTFYASHFGQSFSGALATSVSGVTPGALLGVGVVAACERLPWSPTRRVRFVATHLLLAIIYFGAWTGALRIVHRLEQQFTHALPPPSFDIGMITIMIIYAIIAAVMYAIQAMERLQAEQARVAQLENLRTRAELEALRAQLHPHFLFNALHSVMTLVRHDAKAAEDALEKLAMLLRHTLASSSQNNDVTLREEIKFIRDYLSLEKIRLGERLYVTESIQREALDCMLPPFTLQPLIENSIRHAIASQSAGGVLRIKANRYDGVLTLEVLDDGPGATADEVTNSSGSGLRIARQRLATRYQNKATFQIATQPGEGFAVRMEIPVTESTARLT